MSFLKTKKNIPNYVFACIFFALVFVLIVSLLLQCFGGVLSWTFISMPYFCVIIELIFMSMCDFANFFQDTLNEEQPRYLYPLTMMGYRYIEIAW